jgi:hypothetical protein
MTISCVDCHKFVRGKLVASTDGTLGWNCPIVDNSACRSDAPGYRPSTTSFRQLLDCSSALALSDGRRSVA